MDVRNSRGKFDEIKEKFGINPTPIASQSSLNAGGSRCTRDLPRNLLSSFTNRSKVEEERMKIHAFKEGNWPEDRGQLMRSWGRNSCVVEAVSLGKDVASGLAKNFALTFLQMASISATIRPRSGCDWATIVVLVIGRSPSARMAAIPHR